MQMRNKLDASHLLYLIDLFEGRLRYNEIMYEIPLSYLTEMQKQKEEQLEKEANKMKKDLEIRQERSSGKGGTITNTGKRQL